MADQEPNYVLFHNIYSICSIMVRYCFALRGPPKDPKSVIRIREEAVDIFNEEQLTEHYLCDINAAGEVPVLAPLPLDKTIPDSLDITFYLARFYPSMIPESNKDEISAFLKELHHINFYSLTFTGRPETIHGIQSALKKRLEGPISDRYRKGIDYKLKHMDESRTHAIEPDSIEQNRQRTIKLMKELQPHLEKSPTGWLFGLDRASALDAHLIVFIARMRDVGRNDLIPESFHKYTMKAMEGKEWKDVQTGSTKPPSA